MAYALLTLLWFCGGQLRETVAAEDLVQQSLEQIRNVESFGRGHQVAIEAMRQIRNSDSASVFDPLRAMEDASPLAKNWLRSLASELFDSRPATEPQLLEFFRNRDRDPDARYLVYRWLVRNNPQLKSDLLAEAVSDASGPLRFLAIADLMKRAEAAETSSRDESVALYRQALENARDPNQLKSIVDSLAALDIKVDLADQLGMMTNWYTIAPLDNTSGAGFDKVFPIEQTILSGGAQPLDLEANVDGKNGPLSWSPQSTDDAMGSLDLNPIFDNAKEAVAYAFCQFTVPEAMTAEARLGSINANKVWVNGDLVLSAEVYHAGSMVDQYVGKCQLREGTNWVLVKICQNNQTESWAQDWQFQFRMTDASGKPLDLKVIAPETP
jgi:hypothetical protein